MKLQIPMSVRLGRLWHDIKVRLPFTKVPTLTPEGEAFLLHLKNLYRGSQAYSPMARELVDNIMEQLQVNEREAVQTIYASFYRMGLIDEIDLAELQLISNEDK